MGEIAEALRRVHAAEESSAEAEGSGHREADARDESQDVYSESARRHHEEHGSPEPVATEPQAPRSPSPPAPAPSPAVGPVAAVDEVPEEGIELTHAGAESHAPQGILIDEGGAITDACLQLAMRVRKALEDLDARTLAVVSATRNEGKTTVSCNLALALASLGRGERVALVDLDMRRPSLGTVLELTTPRSGIVDVLLGHESLESARVHVASPSLDVYPCLRGQAKAHELLLRPGFEQAVHALREQYDVVIFDTPPTLLVPDATIMMQHLECFVPVARAGMTRSRRFEKMLETLPRRRMLGAVLDCGSRVMRKSYYPHYGPDHEGPEDEPETPEAVDG
jgi:capsular exopolysaccharide synthesis family protein